MDKKNIFIIVLVLYSVLITYIFFADKYNEFNSNYFSYVVDTNAATSTETSESEEEELEIGQEIIEETNGEFEAPAVSIDDYLASLGDSIISNENETIKQEKEFNGLRYRVTSIKGTGERIQFNIDVTNIGEENSEASEVFIVLHNEYGLNIGKLSLVLEEMEPGFTDNKSIDMQSNGNETALKAFLYAVDYEIQEKN